jgi:hypothetical protein
MNIVIQILLVAYIATSILAPLKQRIYDLEQLALFIYRIIATSFPVRLWRKLVINNQKIWTLVLLNPET